MLGTEGISVVPPRLAAATARSSAR